MYDCTSNNWSHWNSNEKVMEKFGNCTRKTFDRFTTKDRYTWNITHNTESTAVWRLKPEQWWSPLVQEKCQEEKACDKRHPYRTTTTIIIIYWSWAVARWQSLFYMYTKHKIGYYWVLVGRATREVCSGNLESWEPSQHLLLETGKAWKACVEMAGRRTFRILTSSQQSGI